MTDRVLPFPGAAQNGPEGASAQARAALEALIAKGASMFVILAETPGGIVSAEPVPNSVALLEGMLLTAVRLYVHGAQE